MVRPIVLYGDPVLREKCKRVEEISGEMHALAADMLETMHAADGVGLAAPQIGEAIQLAVVDVTGAKEPFSYFRVDGAEANLEDWMPLMFVNPKLTLGKKRERMQEGCLSFPDIREEIMRPEGVSAAVQLLDGRHVVIEADGLLSRAIQHETDHLNGVLFIDRVSAAAKIGLKRKIREMLEEYGGE